jgi:ubiquinone/menaquinone biosynthesis C-methylase UbiE
MLLTDEEIIKKLKIKPDDRVLDVGGSMKQHKIISVDTIVDLIKPEDAPYGSSELLARHFVKTDITRDKLPFKNKEFDICLCTHVLEDLTSPFLIMDEMARVAKRGLIVTPSMGEDMVFTPIDYTDWLTGARRVPGHAHHKWFFVQEKGMIKVIPKNFPVLYTKDFQMIGWKGEREMVYEWKEKIRYEEFVGINIHKLIDEYQRFLHRNKKYIKKGRTLYFIDNPVNSVKSLLKIMLHRGEGYSRRQTL